MENYKKRARFGKNQILGLGVSYAWGRY